METAVVWTPWLSSLTNIFEILKQARFAECQYTSTRLHGVTCQKRVINGLENPNHAKWTQLEKYCYSIAQSDLFNCKKPNGQICCNIKKFCILQREVVVLYES